MKTLRVEFMPPQAWRLVWAMAGVAACAVLGCIAWQGTRMASEQTTLADQTDAMRNEWSAWSHKKPAIAAPRDLSTGKAMLHVQFDLNKVFATMENVDVPGTRLTGFNVDAAAEVLRVEYSMELATKATEITEALNAGYEKRPWRLDRITSTSTPINPGAFQAGPAPMGVSGTWSVWAATGPVDTDLSF